MTTKVDRAAIEKTYGVIKAYIRVTPVVELSGADFGLAAFPLILKLGGFSSAFACVARVGASSGPRYRAQRNLPRLMDDTEAWQRRDSSSTRNKKCGGRG